MVNFLTVFFFSFIIFCVLVDGASIACSKIMIVAKVDSEKIYLFKKNSTSIKYY